MTADHPAALALSTDEIETLTELMGDIQVAASAFYAKTATTTDVASLGPEVRTFLVATQTLHERLSGSVSDKQTYLSALSGTSDGDLITAVKYVRNVAQHVLYVVRPANDSGALVGGLHGMRIYVMWDDVPPAAHNSLQKGTQALRPAFQAQLLGQEVTGTMLSVLRAFARIAPQIVHRDQRGEWTGFPLKTQPSMPGRLHPEEPEDLQEAFVWLNSRTPNGDARLVVGQVTTDGMSLLLGYTVDRAYLTRAFVESSHQVKADVAKGFRYLVGDPGDHSRSEHYQHGQSSGLPFVRIVDELSEWTSALDLTARQDDWGVDLTDSEWDRLVRYAGDGYLPDAPKYEMRRIQRLNT